MGLKEVFVLRVKLLDACGSKLSHPFNPFQKVVRLWTSRRSSMALHRALLMCFGLVSAVRLDGQSNDLAAELPELTPGVHWYFRESEPFQEKMVENLVCYCKQAWECEDVNGCAHIFSGCCSSKFWDTMVWSKNQLACWYRVCQPFIGYGSLTTVQMLASPFPQILHFLHDYGRDYSRCSCIQ